MLSPLISVLRPPTPPLRPYLHLFLSHCSLLVQTTRVWSLGDTDSPLVFGFCSGAVSVLYRGDGQSAPQRSLSLAHVSRMPLISLRGNSIFTVGSGSAASPLTSTFPHSLGSSYTEVRAVLQTSSTGLPGAFQCFLLQGVGLPHILPPSTPSGTPAPVSSPSQSPGSFTCSSVLHCSEQDGSVPLLPPGVSLPPSCLLPSVSTSISLPLGLSVFPFCHKLYGFPAAGGWHSPFQKVREDRKHLG